MMKCLSIKIVFLLFTFHGVLLFGEEKPNENKLAFSVDASLFERELTKEDIKLIIDQFNTYDYVRTKNQREEVINYLLQQSEKQNYNEGIGRCKNILGVLYRDKSEYVKSIEMHESALQIAGNDTILRIYSLNNLGVVYRRFDKPRMALDYHMDALELSEKFKGDPIVSKQSICVALNSIGNIHLAMNQPAKALEVFNESLLLEEQLDNDLGIAINFQNIGHAYEDLGKPETALIYYNKSLSQNEKINSVVGRSICYNSIGEIYLRQNDYLAAINNFRLAMVYAQQTNDNYYISQTHANIGKTYLNVGKLEKALPELLEYNKLAEGIGSGLLISDSYKLLSLYFEKLGDAPKALILYKKSVAYNDSIMNEKNSRYLNEMQTLYDAKKRQQQIELLTAENRMKTQKNYLYLSLTFVILLALFVVYIFTKRETDKQRLELESKLFRSLMNPHFIFNALASVQSFMYKNEPEKAATYLGHFSKLTRSILANSNKELITLGEELDALKNYIEIEQMRQRDCFSYQIDVDPKLELDFIYILPTMLQPFVENAIQHGMCGKKDLEGKLNISISQYNDMVRIEIKDNGRGIKNTLDKDKKPLHNSMGLRIFKERIKLLGRKYKKTVFFSINDLSELNANLHGTIITIDFPIIEPYD
jgi:tetratricopeptide (TPR) repeat protein